MGRAQDAALLKAAQHGDEDAACAALDAGADENCEQVRPRCACLNARGTAQHG
jgi:hypothetical protein